MNIILLFFVFLVEFSLIVFGKTYDGYEVVRATPKIPSHLRWLNALLERNPGLQLDFWSEPTILGHDVEIMIGPDHVGLMKEMMEEVKLPYIVIIEDVERKIVEEQTANSKRNVGGPSNGYAFDRYLPYIEMMLWLDNEIATSCFGGLLCESINIGHTHEGRDMKVIKIGTGGSGKRKVWVDAGIHAREWIAHATALFFIERLMADYHTDAAVKQLLDTYDFYLLPCINADGYVYTHTVDRLWRKSRTLWPGNQCYGTDVNRNFNHNWNLIGASQDSCSNTYSGPSYYSEVESKNMADYLMASKGQWEVYLTLHSKGQLWMAPWGYTTNPPADYEELMRVGGLAVEALTAVHGTDYTLGSASEILYASSGTSRDWAYGAMEIPYVFTIELRDKGEHGWILPPEQILPTGEETWAGFRAMLIGIGTKA